MEYGQTAIEFFHHKEKIKATQKGKVQPRAHLQTVAFLLILFVPGGDVSASLQQQLADMWMTHLSGQHQRSPAILQKRQTHKESRQSHANKRKLILKSTVKDVIQGDNKPIY